MSKVNQQQRFQTSNSLQQNGDGHQTTLVKVVITSSIQLAQSFKIIGNP